MHPVGSEFPLNIRSTMEEKAGRAPQVTATESGKTAADSPG
jgi:hypothetical protein